MSALINFILDGLLLIVVLKILNDSKGISFYEYLTLKVRKFLAKVIVFTIVIFLIAKTFIPFLEQKNSVELTFYETQPSDLTYIPVYVLVFYIAYKGLTSFSKSVNIVVFALILGVITVLALSLSAAEYYRVLPIFQVPIKTVLNGSFKTLLWFGDPLYLLFFSKKILKTEKLNLKISLGYIISTLIFIGGLITFYAVFEGLAPRQYFAPLKMSKYSVTLSNIGRFDYFATLLIITANVYSLALPLTISSSLLNEVFKSKNEWVFPLIITTISLTLTIIFSKGFYARLAFMQNYFIWFLLIVNYALPLLILLVKPTAVKRNPIAVKNERKGGVDERI